MDRDTEFSDNYTQPMEGLGPGDFSLSKKRQASVTSSRPSIRQDRNEEFAASDFGPASPVSEREQEEEPEMTMESMERNAAKAAHPAMPPPLMNLHGDRNKIASLEAAEASKLLGGLMPEDEYMQASKEASKGRKTPMQKAKLTCEEIWIMIKHADFTSPPYLPLFFPEVGLPSSEIKKKTVVYATYPEPRDKHLFKSACRNFFYEASANGFAKVPEAKGLPSFLDTDGNVEHVDIELVTRPTRDQSIKNTSVHVECKTMLQAAGLLTIKHLEIPVTDGSKTIMIKLNKRSAGLCHHPALITIDMTAISTEEGPTTKVDINVIALTIKGLMDLYPGTELKGMWRKGVLWNNDELHETNLIRFCLSLPPGVKPSDLPGFGNQMGDYETTTPHPEAIWFRFNFGGRKMFCQTCKTRDAIHSRKDCPLEPCHECSNLGHTSYQCPERARPAKRRS